MPTLSRRAGTGARPHKPIFAVLNRPQARSANGIPPKPRLIISDDSHRPDDAATTGASYPFALLHSSAGAAEVLLYHGSAMRTVEPPPDLELDHLVVCTSDRAEALEALIAAGLSPGPRRVHHGQGTANDCFYFRNAYIELLWMNDEAEIRSPAVKPLCLWERIHWRQTGACPFGVAFRPMEGFELAQHETWPYQAAYLPAGQSIPILSPRDAANEALVFLSMNPLPPSSYGDEASAHLIHRGQSRRITRLALAAAGEIGANAPASGGRDGRFVPHMVLELDGGLAGMSGFRPILPVEIHW